MLDARCLTQNKAPLESGTSHLMAGCNCKDGDTTHNRSGMRRLLRQASSVKRPAIRN